MKASTFASPLLPDYGATFGEDYNLAGGHDISYTPDQARHPLDQALELEPEVWSAPPRRTKADLEREQAAAKAEARRARTQAKQEARAKEAALQQKRLDRIRRYLHQRTLRQARRLNGPLPDYLDPNLNPAYPARRPSLAPAAPTFSPRPVAPVFSPPPTAEDPLYVVIARNLQGGPSTNVTAFVNLEQALAAYEFYHNSKNYRDRAYQILQISGVVDLGTEEETI